MLNFMLVQFKFGRSYKMIIKVKKNPTTCGELADFIGYPVKSWTRFPDGGMEIDVDAELNPGQKLALIKKLGEIESHLVDDS